MKRSGIFILILGVVITIVTGFRFITREKVLDLGEIEITANRSHLVSWSPLIGLGIVVVGGVLYILGNKKEI